MEGLIVRGDLQQDKRSALLAVARMFDDHHVPYVVTGGLAVQLYTPQPRNTVDVDIVAPRPIFEALKAQQPWARYGFELVFDRRRYLKLKHLAGNVEVDINLDSRFARLLEAHRTESVDGCAIRFCAPLQIAFAKLRTQRSDWPRDPAKRAQDRTDLMKMLQLHPELAEPLRRDPMTTGEMLRILNDICRELSAPSTDELPPEEGGPHG